MPKIIERNVRCDYARDMYVVTLDDGTEEFYPFDRIMEHIDRIVLELTMYGADTPVVSVFRGGRETWDTYRILCDLLKKHMAEAGEQQAVFALSPQLVGLEGHLVDADCEDGEIRRFIVGQSRGWAPYHTELKTPGDPTPRRADMEYGGIVDLGVAT